MTRPNEHRVYRPALPAYQAGVRATLCFHHLPVIYGGKLFPIAAHPIPSPRARARSVRDCNSERVNGPRPAGRTLPVGEPAQKGLRFGGKARMRGGNSGAGPRRLFEPVAFSRRRLSHFVRSIRGDVHPPLLVASGANSRHYLTRASSRLAAAWADWLIGRPSFSTSAPSCCSRASTAAIESLSA